MKVLSTYLTHSTYNHRTHSKVSSVRFWPAAWLLIGKREREKREKSIVR